MAATATRNRTAYLSSTFDDLQSFRAAAAKGLRRLGLQVVGMEDYVAADQRPLDQCLADVERCDLYVGLFAHRYGYIPEAGNPDGLSITELEYRQALNRKPCLIFLVADDADWKRKFMDEVTGEGEDGRRIKALRGELAKERLASFFTTPEELASLVTAAAARALDDAPASSSAAPDDVKTRLKAISLKLEKQKSERLMLYGLKAFLGVCVAGLLAGGVGSVASFGSSSLMFLLFGVFCLPPSYVFLSSYESCTEAITTFSIAAEAGDLPRARAAGEKLTCYRYVREVLHGLR
jgi:hypothetical protein